MPPPLSAVTPVEDTRGEVWTSGSWPFKNRCLRDSLVCRGDRSPEGQGGPRAPVLERLHRGLRPGLELKEVDGFVLGWPVPPPVPSAVPCPTSLLVTAVSLPGTPGAAPGPQACQEQSLPLRQEMPQCPGELPSAARHPVHPQGHGDGAEPGGAPASCALAALSPWP